MHATAQTRTKGSSTNQTPPEPRVLVACAVERGCRAVQALFQSFFFQCGSQLVAGSCACSLQRGHTGVRAHMDRRRLHSARTSDFGAPFARSFNARRGGSAPGPPRPAPTVCAAIHIVHSNGAHNAQRQLCTRESRPNSDAHRALTSIARKHCLNTPAAHASFMSNLPWSGIRSLIHAPRHARTVRSPHIR